VVSAIGKTTDHLLALTNGGTGIVETDRDDILAMGERTSARVFAASLKSHGILSRYFDPSDRDWPIITDDNFQNANPISKRCIKRIQSFAKPIVEQGIVPVIGGFIGRTVDGRISTLGRGGSDTTALLLASALGADEVVLVTSSNGILTADPRLVSNPKRIPEIDMKALIGIADAGTKFIHRKALRFKNDHIPIRVISNTDANLNSPGTTVTGSPFLDLDVKIHNPHPVASVTLVGSNLSKNPQFIRKIIRLAGSNLEAASQDEDSVIIYLKQTPHFKSQLDKLHRTVLETAEGIAMATKTGMALITVKGIGLEGTPGIVARISETLRSDKINIFGLLTISSSVIVLVEWGKRKRAGRLIKIALRQENN
jgi:aspartate kinase